MPCFLSYQGLKGFQNRRINTVVAAAAVVNAESVGTALSIIFHGKAGGRVSREAVVNVRPAFSTGFPPERELGSSG